MGMQNTQLELESSRCQTCKVSIWPHPLRPPLVVCTHPYRSQTWLHGSIHLTLIPHEGKSADQMLIMDWIS
jgi:hypothetical protein